MDARCRPNIYLSGVPLSELSVQRQAQQRVWIPQRYDEPFTITVTQALRSVAPDVSIEYILNQLAVFGLRKHAQAWVHQLSGGERQRVALARALVTKPAVVLADEPTGNLDRKTAGGIFELLTDLKKELNMAMLIVTHDEQLAQAADSILHMEDGLWVNGS